MHILPPPPPTHPISKHKNTSTCIAFRSSSIQPSNSNLITRLSPFPYIRLSVYIPYMCLHSVWGPRGRGAVWSTRITRPVPLLLTGVRHHPPGRTDKNLCRCFGAPARRGFSLIT